MVLRIVMPRLRKKRKIRAASNRNSIHGHGRNFEATQESLDFRGRPLASQALQDFAKHQIPNDDLVPSERLYAGARREAHCDH